MWHIWGMSPTPPPPITPEELAALPPEFEALLQRIIDHYEGVISKLQAHIAKQDARIAALEAELAGYRKTPRNSSVPPSTEHPHAKPVPKTPSSGRKRGGQPGHPKAERKLIPSDECDEVLTLKPTRCRTCDAPLDGNDKHPLRHQVWEIPQPKPIVTEYQCHRVVCQCGVSTCAKLPEGVPEHMAGPRLVAVAAMLLAYFRQSKSRTRMALAQLFGIPVSESMVVKLQDTARRALEEPREEVAAAVAKAKVVYADETPTKEASRKAWLWTAATSLHTLFALRPTRAGDEIGQMLGPDFAGSIVTDRCKSYERYNGQRQICWAHLKRDFQAVVDKKGEGAAIGERLLTHLEEVFKHWRRYRAGEITRGQLQWRVRHKVCAHMFGTLEDGLRHRSARGMCGDLLNRWDQMWLFLDEAGVEPTNNAAERALRQFVIWRKLSFGTQSAGGSRFVETMLTIIETCRLQTRNLLDYLTEAVTAHNRSERAPSLVFGV